MNKAGVADPVKCKYYKGHNNYDWFHSKDNESSCGQFLKSVLKWFYSACLTIQMELSQVGRQVEVIPSSVIESMRPLLSKSQLQKRQ